MSYDSLDQIHEAVSRVQDETVSEQHLVSLGDTDLEKLRSLSYLNQYLREFASDIDEEGYIFILGLVMKSVNFQLLDKLVCKSLERSLDILDKKRPCRDLKLNDLAIITADVVCCAGLKIQRPLLD
jgi:hypothetical protein